MALLDDGMSQSDVAREISVTRQTVSRWAKLKAAYPDDEPWRKRPMGRPRRLTDGQKVAFTKVLADSYVLELGRTRKNEAKPARWTLARVGGLLKTEFGVSYSLAHVKTILTDLVGDEQWLLSKPRFWACVIELAYPEYEGKTLVPVSTEDWDVSGNITRGLRRRLRS